MSRKSLFSAQEVYNELCGKLNVHDKLTSSFRRNVITSDVDLNGWIGEGFEIQGVRSRGIEECRTCHWMNKAFAPGAEEFLRGNGGLRAIVLSDGKLCADDVGIHASASSATRRAEA
jgi:MOSC domain-containing protein YiiM